MSSINEKSKLEKSFPVNNGLFYFTGFLLDYIKIFS